MIITIELLALLISACGFIWQAAKLDLSIKQQLRQSKIDIKIESEKQQIIFLDNFNNLQKHYAERYREMCQMLETLKLNDAATYNFRTQANKDIHEIQKEISSINAKIEMLVENQKH